MPVRINELTAEVRQVPVNGQPGFQLTPEMVRIVADKVMAMFQNELRIEAERARSHSRTSRPVKGRK
jgi:hypothetical protein